MEFSSEFIPLKLDEVPALSDRMKSEHARFVQILAVNTDAGVDLVYSFMMDGGALCNYEVKGVKKTDVVTSITGNFLAAFVFENEIHDLFGVTIEGIAIDFGGKFYQLAQSEPMTIISPAQKAAREKAAKAAEAKRARAAKVAETEYAADHPDAIKQMKPKVSGIDPAQMTDFEERFAGTDPEKLARIKAAFAAKAAKAAEVEQSRESKRETRAAELENLDPEKAAKVRAALERKKKAAEAKRAVGSTNVERDAEIEAKLAQLDPERAAKVRAALDAKARKETAERAANTGKDGE